MTASTPDSHRMTTLVPAPVAAEPSDDTFELAESTELLIGTPAAEGPASALAETLRRATGFDFEAVEDATGDPADAIHLTTDDPPADLDPGGYHLDVEATGVSLRARGAAGLFAGIATIRQLLPPTIDSPRKQPGPWRMHGGSVRDAPRFEYRGAQLDVARHFFTVDEVKRFVDLIAGYKCNYLHLHLTDNEGWRLEIEAWPRLTADGASTDIDGGDGGFYTVEDYETIVEYAASRGITVVPELDMPAHTGAVVAAYPDLSHGDPPDGMPADSGTLAVDREHTYEFVEDVIDEVAARTPGPFLHIGGDEADDLTDAEYTRFIDRVLPMVTAADKRPIAWQEIAVADPPESTIVQYWKDTDPELSGHDVIFSPNTHTYLNFRYDEETPPDGPETWGRRITSVPTSYDWDPGDYYDPVPESAVLGAEFELWSEELATFDDVTYMALPRLAGVAERSWSRASDVGWDGFAPRLAAQAPRWCAMGFEYYRTSAVDWSG